MSAILDEAGKYMNWLGNPNRASRAHAFDRAVFEAVDRTGTKSSLDYDDASGFLNRVTNARGETTTSIFTPVVQTITNPDNAETVNITFFDLTRVDFADGTHIARVFDSKGNVTSSTDRDGDTTTRTFNARGQTLTRTNPEGGVTTFTYNAAARLATSTDTDTGVTSYGYDTLNRLTLLTRPDTSTAAFTYDALDRPLTRTDERGTVTKFDYDANDNLTAVTRDFGGALAQTTALEYDALDRLVKTTDPAGQIRRFDYPYHEAVSKITHPDGTTTRFEYDARRALAAVVDEAGSRASFERDADEQLIKATSPEQRIATLERDALGAVTARIDHTGDRTEAELDEFSRVTATTDPLGRKRSVIRDGEGRVTTRTEPLAGDTVYQYDDNGLLTQLTDARGKIWAFTHTDMGRLDTVTDPNGGIWDRDYDTRGRLSQITYPGGVVETRVYDAESNLTARNFSDGLNLGYTFDALDRLSATASTPVALAYDTRDNLTATTIHGQTFTATHDSRSRLATLDYAGQMTVTYTYDARSLVTRVTDSLSGAQVDITYNADRQMTKVTRSNGIVTDYAYDAEGKIATIQHGALGAIGFTFNAANEPTAITDTGFPVDGAAALTSASTETQTFDDANQLTSGGHAYDLRGRPTTDGTRTFTWDSADRLTQVVNGADTVAYDYTATGELAARTLNGQTTQFGYSYSVADRPILAERKAGAFTRFYVALPNGRLLYEIELTPTPAARFYHFGKVGETRLLTDATGAVTDAFAYDAFGRLLARTGTSDQIYTFVGELGVRDDPAAGLIHMRARYYDPISGRFLSRDPIFLALAGRNSQSANPYHYVEGMATWVVDPSGLDVTVWDIFKEVGEVFAEIATLGYYESSHDILVAKTIANLEEFEAMDAIIKDIRNDLAQMDEGIAENESRIAQNALRIAENERMLAENERMLNAIRNAESDGHAELNARNRARAAFADNKAAAKALIGRALGEFLRFVPIRVRDVKSAEKEEEDEVDRQLQNLRLEDAFESEEEEKTQGDIS